jgi:CDP-glucose 4,6-dehydratase
LDCLSGYLLLGQRLVAGDRKVATSWNFGPGAEGNCTVEGILRVLQSHWPDLRWRQATANQPHEATLLQLDSSRAHHLLGWKPVWSLAEGLAATAAWYTQHRREGSVASAAQLRAYLARAVAQGAVWTG